MSGMIMDNEKIFLLIIIIPILYFYKKTHKCLKFKIER